MNCVYSSALWRDSARSAAMGKTPWGVHTSQAIFNALRRAKHARLLTQSGSLSSKRVLFVKYLPSSRDFVVCTIIPYDQPALSLVPIVFQTHKVTAPIMDSSSGKLEGVQ